MKTVLITGSSQGIGRQAAILFAKQNWNVIIHGFHHKEALDSLSEELQEIGVNFLSFLGDIGDSEFTKHMIKEALSHFHSIDCLVNNAGISQVGLFTDTTFDDWMNIIQTNLLSAISTSHALLPSMISNKSGRIINISSVWGSVGASCEVLYSMTKGGINSFTKALAKEVAPSHIAVNAIAFGMIDTEMNSCFSEEEKQEICDEIPADYIASPEEAAQMIYHTATAPFYMTGEVITFSGAWS
ncbi:MAG: SDR family NAD(P)-dependent oxidoreductase [Anaerostipes sp.]|nr:SDR family NAD(P)-dependent oxidoreductase [Anaerostipes sp.]